ncbi:Leucine-rich repeat-containing protein 27 [Fukomys damarensis]|uniref:Leucine-rich repeat-containing protein 27 n=1 Tax=Fukomys damarensis TaxID=885580 RepID=A0A091E673_FUKDA|nr:Leucine-rich repeat-containing protein 27 [Fukomys damarensis]
MEGSCAGAADDTEKNAGQAWSLSASPSRDVHKDSKGIILSSSSTLDLSQSGLCHLEKVFRIPNLQLVVQKGVAAILTFLRICAAEHDFPRDAASQESSPVKKMDLHGLPDLVQHLSKYKMSTREIVTTQNPTVAVIKQKVDFPPPIERLDLSVLRRSTESPEQWLSEEEIKRFWKLRQEIVENEKAEVLENQLLPIELPPNIKAALNTKGKEHSKPRHMFRSKRPSFKNILPALSSPYQTMMPTKRLEERRVTALRELREKQALMEQRRRDKKALQEWREQAQMLKKKKEELSKLLPSPRGMESKGTQVFPGSGADAIDTSWSSLCGSDDPCGKLAAAAEGLEVASKIPFATHMIDHGRIPVSPQGKKKHGKESLSQACEEISPSRVAADLEEKIKRHIQQMHSHRSFQGAPELQEMKTATQDLNIAKKLQDEVMKLKLELNKEHPFATLTGNLSLHSPTS